jgi:hypothetical protein
VSENSLVFLYSEKGGSDLRLRREWFLQAVSQSMPNGFMLKERSFDVLTSKGTGWDSEVKELDRNQLDLCRARYSELLLNRYLVPYSGRNPFIRDDHQYEQLVAYCISKIENFIEVEQVKLVVTDPFISRADAQLDLFIRVCEVRGIPTYMVAKTAHRMSIQEGGSFSAKDLHLDYARRRTKTLTHEEEKILEHAISAFIEFKRSDQFIRQITKQDNGKDLLDAFTEFKRKLINRLRANTASRSEVTFPKYDEYDLDSDYVVLLLNKRLNYRLSLNSPVFSDMVGLIRAIAVSLPLGCQLFVKSHPHSLKAGEEENIVRECARFANIRYIDPRIETQDVVSNAKVVFSVASTAGFEALFQFKHVVVFGKDQFFFGMHDAPIFRVSNLETLVRVIGQCLKSPPNEKEIKNYLFSWFSTSDDLMGTGIWERFEIGDPYQQECYESAGQFLVDFLRNGELEKAVQSEYKRKEESSKRPC